MSKRLAPIDFPLQRFGGTDLAIHGSPKGGADGERLIQTPR
jgi:hypothetical protein